MNAGAAAVDPLLECLAFLTAHYGAAKSPKALTSGLPYGEGAMGPDLFCAAAARAGLKTRIVRRSTIKAIPPAVLPAVLILKDNQACILMRVSENEHGAVIWSPDTRAERDVSLTDLKQSYAGYAIFAHPLPSPASVEKTGEDEGRIHWMWDTVSDSRPLYVRVIVAAALINLFALASPIFIMNVYDRVIPNNAVETGWVLGIGALTVFLFDFIMRTLRGYFIDLAGRRTDVVAAQRIYSQLLDMKLAERPASSGAFANMLREFDSVRDFYTSATLTAVVDLPFTLFFLFVIWTIGGPIALMLAVLIAIAGAIGAILQAPLKDLVRKSARSAEAKHGLLVETIQGLETIKAIGADGRLRARYARHVAENAILSQGARFVSALGVNIATFAQQVSSVLIVFLGMYMVQDSAITVGGLIACVLLGGRAVAPVGQVANLMSRWHSARGALKTLDRIMQRPVERPPGAAFLHRPDLKGKIAFSKVSFAYPGIDRGILDSITFTIQPGEKVGLIGRIGSGKSTIARLMMGLYDPAGGTILFDDTDHRQIDPADLRRNVAYIAQDVTLFSGTVRDNITASRPDASESEILEAARASGVHDFVSRHPMGYAAPVGEGGVNLSGGQRQAIALARAILLRPGIYICDEPTNAMDVQAEAAFTNHIAREAKGHTLILITHRQHLLSLVDRLILIDQGRVVMDGPRGKVLDTLASGGVEVPKEQR